jgi:hypothetical protein
MLTPFADPLPSRLETIRSTGRRSCRGCRRLWTPMENAARFPQPSTTPWKTSDVFLSPLGNQALRPWFPTAPPPLRRRFTKWLSSPDPGLTAYRGTDGHRCATKVNGRAGRPRHHGASLQRAPWARGPGSGWKPDRMRSRFRNPSNRATIPSVSDDRVRFPWPFRWRCRSLPPSLSLTLFRVGPGGSEARGRLAEDGFDRDGAAAWQGNRDSPIVETSTGKLRHEV